MKKVLLAGLTIFGLTTFIACSSDDDNDDGKPSVIGVWNLDEQILSGEGTLDAGFLQVPYNIRSEKIGGSGTLEFATNPREIKGNGIIEVETEFEVILLGDTISDNSTEMDDLSEGTRTYEIKEGNKIIITEDGDSQEFDYVITDNSMTITGKVIVTEEGPTGQDLEFELDAFIKLSR